jgi:guanylate kinase
MSAQPAALLIVVSAPSGAGKSTLCRRLVADDPRVTYSVSCTTRPPRGAEQDGVHYHFLSAGEFRSRLARGEFLEHAEVHGRLYGTLRQPVVDALAAGRSVLMDIDVQGASQIRGAVRKAPGGDPLRRAFVDIFIEPPSMEALRQRLIRRGEDSEKDVIRRLGDAEAEMARRAEFQHRIVNDDLEAAYREFVALIRAEQRRRQA